ncbi:MAG TPA: hypothetical protein VK172_14705 [Lentimicrobium sp.]|nr:hypothetical protein [Bacteroidales bacterium]HLO92412.1 hypothetical protein [Lentimicrobium sp.]
MKTFCSCISMFILGCNISIGGYTFNRCTEVKIEKSIDLVSSTAVIVLPISAVLVSKGEKTTVETARLITVGMPVSIELSYNGIYSGIEYTGYVKVINHKIPLEIECENIYPLRKKNINKVWASTTLQDILKEIVSGTDITLSSEVPAITMSPYSIKNASGAFALQKLKDDFGLTVYLDESNRLYAGLAYTKSTGTVKYFLNGSNVNVINADDLKYRNKEDVLLKIKAIGVSGNNTRTEVEVGDQDGELRTLFFYNITSKTDLTRLATQQLNKLKFDGYEGKLLTFLIPKAVPGMTAILNDERFPVRSGNYYIDSVMTTWGTQGARREVGIGIKLQAS